MTRRNKCEICGNDSKKSKVCSNCKENYPYRFSRQGMPPFNRKKEYDKRKKKR